MSILVLVHEFGHFFAAKKMGVHVEEFGLGIPPTAIKKKIGDTIYSLNWLPFGGFVRLAGEDLEDTAEIKAARHDSSNFMSKTALQRAIILSAGVFMNVVLALALYYVFFFFTGFKTLNLPLIFDYNFRFGNVTSINTVVTSMEKGSAADLAGIEPGEAILEINNKPVYSIADVRREVADKAGQKVSLLLMDEKQNTKHNLRTVSATPQKSSQGKGILGVFLSKSIVIDYSQGWNKLLAGPMQAYNMLAYSKFVFGKLIGLSVESKSAAPVSEGVAGPVGIYTVIGGILNYGGTQAFLGMVDFVALMSLSLAFLNIMPFPALDGGRLLFVVIEMITGKKMNVHIESQIHKWGMILLLGLIVLITLKDVGNLFG